MVKSREYDLAQAEALDRVNKDSAYRAKLTDSTNQDITDDNPQPTKNVGVVDSNNSTSTPLLTGQSFIGIATLFMF